MPNTHSTRVYNSTMGEALGTDVDVDVNTMAASRSVVRNMGSFAWNDT